MALNRFYYPTKYKSQTEVVALGVKCIFISHQQKDKEAAQKIADYLLKAGIDVYFDEYDKDLKIHNQNNSPKAVTQAICNGINNSSHMLVLVSPNTLFSTWVPFEIGYGFDVTDLSVLCLKGIPKGGLPEYVRSAKILRDLYDLNILVTSISGKSKELLLERKMMSDYDSYSNPLTSVMDNMISDQY